MPEEVARVIRELGRQGGKRTASKYGREHMRRIASRGGKVTAARYGRDPRMRPWYRPKGARIPIR
jgi:general stress protein YciG